MNSDPELDLDPATGSLRSLYKQGSQTLLTADQVASCVQFYTLSVQEKEDDLPQAVPQRCEAQPGLKVNVIGGATGSGKTSLIHIAAGGMETPSQASSDTKCPTVYMVNLDGNARDTFALLDTAGLCDTAAMATQDVGMQELLINAVAATVKKFKFEIVNFLMCVDVAARLPGNFADVWPQMQIALGGEELGSLCHFVLTKANGDSKVDKKKLKQLPKQALYQDLVGSTLKWPVILAGRENLESLVKVLKPTTTKMSGISSASVDPRSKSIAAKKQLANELESQIRDGHKRIQECELSVEELIETISTMREKIAHASGRLDTLGWCDNKEKVRLKKLIYEKTRELNDIQEKRKQERLTSEETKKAMKKLQEAFEKEMTEIRRMYKLGSFFRSIAGGVGATAGVVLRSML